METSLQTRRPVAVITGASGGVGRATAVELARQGFDVGLLARGVAGLAAAAHDVELAGGRAEVATVDVADAEAVFAAAEVIERTLGPIDVWINNAMATVFSDVERLKPDELARAMEVTFLGQAYGTMAALEAMRSRDRGTIVNVGSALAFVGIPLQGAYCAAKFACRGFVHSTRAELIARKSAIRVAMVHLPAVNTPQFSWCTTRFTTFPRPVAPVYTPEFVAQRIVRSALDGRTRAVGSWNRLAIALAQIWPEVAIRFGALTAVDGQLSDDQLPTDHEANLHAPVDGSLDHGAAGRYRSEAKGIVDPIFLKGLPKSAIAFGRAISGALARYRSPAPGGSAGALPSGS